MGKSPSLKEVAHHQLVSVNIFNFKLPSVFKKFNDITLVLLIITVLLIKILKILRQKFIIKILKSIVKFVNYFMRPSITLAWQQPSLSESMFILTIGLPRDTLRTSVW